MSKKSSKDFHHSSKEVNAEKQPEEKVADVTEKTDVESQNIDTKTEPVTSPDEKITEEQTLTEKLNELNDKYLRLYSEFDNFRKRTHKERIEMSRMAASEVITDFLPVLDDFERAIKSTSEAQDCDSVKEGVNLIYNKFKGILEKKGVKVIDAIGQEFNTDFHEAITYIQAPSDDLKNKIVDEVEKGYLLGDKVIRYSKVVIGQ